MGMKRFKDDYEVVSTIDEKGRENRKAVYRGDYFEISLDEVSLLNFRRYSIFLIIGILVLHTVGGFVNNQGMYQFYVSIPYVLGFLPMFNFAFGSFILPRETRKYRRDEKELSFDRMKTSSRLLVIFLGISILGEILYLILFSGGIQIIQEIGFLLLEVVAAIGAYFLVKLQRPVLISVCDENQEL